MSTPTSPRFELARNYRARLAKVLVSSVILPFSIILPCSVLLLSSCAKSPPGNGEAGAAAQDRVGASRKMSSTADLADKRIGVVLGSVYDTYATKTYPNATVLHYESGTDLSLAVTSRKVDAGLSDEEPLAERLRNNSDLAVLGEPVLSLPLGVGFRKDNTALRDEFNRFLAQLRASGVHADMVDRWLVNHDTRMPEVAIADPRGTLLVGISSGGLPYAAIQDGTLVGFDIELVERFAAHVGRKAVYSDVPFGGLIAAAASGKVEMIAASIFITDERKERIDFSDPYHETDGLAYTLKSNLAGSADAEAPESARTSFLSKVASSFHSNIVLERRYLLLWDGLKTTALIAVLATLFGTALGALVCFLRMSRLAVLNVPARIYIAVLRGIPVVVLLMLIFYVVFAAVDIDPVLVAVIAFGMNFAAYVSEIFRSGIEGVDRGQSEAATAMGFTKPQTFGFIVLPQMIQRILPVYKGEFISLVKMTSIVGYIAVQDLTKASDIIRSRTFSAFFPLIMVAVLYFLISWFLMQALGYLERMTDPRHRRRKAAAR
jgi:polar amino acid transport system substrate-binding protein